MKLKQQKISVVINTYNAARFLPQVLEATRYFDEILVCDMESTDNTRRIAEEYGCRIVTFHRGYHTIVEPARDFAIHKASFPWILVVYADELVPKKLHDYLYDFITHPDSVVGLKIPRKNHFMGRFMHGTYPDYILRFFRKDLCTWPSVIHAQPIIQGRVEKIPSKNKQLAFVHLPNENIHDRMEKIDRYTENEIIRRHDMRYGWMAFFYRPMHRFMKSYFVKGGWRDGYPGFIYALLDSIYQVVMLSKLKEQHL